MKFQLIFMVIFITFNYLKFFLCCCFSIRVRTVTTFIIVKVFQQTEKCETIFLVLFKGDSP
jgi:hypothetical protein